MHDFDVGDGLNLRVNETGAGPPLMLLHGFTGSSETWTTLLPAFSASYRVITVDLPGHGRSAAPGDPSRYSLVSFAEDLRRLLDALSVDRVALMGYSMGGRAVLRFAVSCHDRLAAIVLESTSPGIADPDVRRQRIADDAALAGRIENDGMRAFVDEWESLPLWESQRALPDEVRDALRKQRLLNSPKGLANSLRGAGAGVDSPLHDRLGDIQTPALIVAGALDARYVEIATMLAASIPNARTSIIPGAGHAVHLERPEVLAEEVISFLSSVASAGGRWGSS